MSPGQARTVDEPVGARVERDGERVRVGAGELEREAAVARADVDDRASVRPRQPVELTDVHLDEPSSAQRSHWDILPAERARTITVLDPTRDQVQGSASHALRPRSPHDPRPPRSRTPAARRGRSEPGADMGCRLPAFRSCRGPDRRPRVRREQRRDDRVRHRPGTAGRDRRDHHRKRASCPRDRSRRAPPLRDELHRRVARRRGLDDTRGLDDRFGRRARRRRGPHGASGLHDRRKLPGGRRYDDEHDRGARERESG